MKRVGKRLRILRGGSGFTRVGFLPADRHIRRGGDACVALAGERRFVGSGRFHGEVLHDIGVFYELFFDCRGIRLDHSYSPPVRKAQKLVMPTRVV